MFGLAHYAWTTLSLLIPKMDSFMSLILETRGVRPKNKKRKKKYKKRRKNNLIEF